jgi:hypothetical protein
LLDEVSHQSIFNLIKEFSSNLISICIGATYDQRLRRYFYRSKKIDINKYQSIFDEASAHPVEQETTSLKTKCEFVIVSSDNMEDDFQEADKILTYNGIYR